MKRIRTTKNTRQNKGPTLSFTATKALLRAINSVCDPDGWTTVATELGQCIDFYDDTDDIPVWAYQEALHKVEWGIINPAELDPRLCDKCQRGKHSDLHEEECLKSDDQGTIEQ